MSIFMALMLAGQSPVDGSKQGSWTIEVDKDAMTDKAVVSANVRSATARIDYGCGLRSGDVPLIMIRTTTFLGSSYPGHRFYITAQIRFDDAAPIKLDLIANDDTATAMTKNQVTPLLAGLMRAERIRGRILAYRGEPVDFDFDVKGFAAAKAQVDASCFR